MHRMLRQYAIAILLVLGGSFAQACAICAPADAQNTLVHRLFAADTVVLAIANPDGSSFQPVELIKGALPGGSITVAQWLTDAPPGVPGAPVLLLYSSAAQSWRAAGTLGLQRAGWLRRVVALRPVAALVEPDWPGRLAVFAADLEDAEPVVAQTAYEEISAAPYSAMRSLKPGLRAPRIARWLDDPTLAARRPLYTLLFGLAGSAEDAAALEKWMPRASNAAEAAQLAAALAAYLELRGTSGAAWIEREYLTRTTRGEAEVQAAVLALGVHGNDGIRVSRERVVSAYATLIERNRGMAGFAASDLANWGHWEFGGHYADILKSGETLVFSSRYAMLFYLLRSPRPDARAALEALRAAP